MRVSNDWTDTEDERREERTREKYEKRIIKLFYNFVINATKKELVVEANNRTIIKTKQDIENSEINQDDYYVLITNPEKPSYSVLLGINENDFSQIEHNTINLYFGIMENITEFTETMEVVQEFKIELNDNATNDLLSKYNNFVIHAISTLQTLIIDTKES